MQVYMVRFFSQPPVVRDPPSRADFPLDGTVIGAKASSRFVSVPTS